MVEQSLVEYIFPKNIENEAERCLSILSIISNKAQKALIAVIDKKMKTIKDVKTFVEFSKKNIDGVTDGAVNKVATKLISHLSNRFPDPQKASNLFSNIYKSLDKKLVKLLGDSVNLTLEDQVRNRSLKDFRHYSEQILEINDSFENLVNRINILFNKKTVNKIVQLSKGNSNAEMFLKEISRISPELFQTQIDKLLHQLIASNKINVGK